LTGAERGFILLTEEGSAPRVAAVRGADASATLRLSRTVADRVLRSGEVLAVADIVGREELSTRRSILDLGLRSVLCAPIRSAGRQLGLLYVDSRRVGSLLSERDLGLLSAFAALAGSALQNARLIDDLRRKGDLLAHMAHQFRSPLNAILLHAQAAKLRSQADPDLDAMGGQISWLIQIVDRTLERSTMGALDPIRAKVNLAEVARTAIAALQPVSTMKSIQVTLSVDPDLPEVVGDSDRLVQVIANLVGNAVHYSHRGSRVWVRMAAGDPVPTAKPPPRIEVEDQPPS